MINLTTQLERFLVELQDDPTLVSEISKRANIPNSTSKRQLEIYINEAHAGWQVIAPHVARGQRILEIGAGLGLLSWFLCEQGYDATALEPVGSGFEFFESAGDILRVRAGTAYPPFLAIGAEQLEPSTHGTFDLLFSVNVLEHMTDVRSAFRTMASVLKTDSGFMVHNCPNYRIPYEPHFGIWLIPFLTSVNDWLYANSIAKRQDLWDSLNFITAGDVRKLCRENGLTVIFSKGLLGDAVERLTEDKTFAQRHTDSVFIRMVLAGRKVGLVRLLRALPPEWSTPMTFIARPE